MNNWIEALKEYGIVVSEPMKQQFLTYKKYLQEVNAVLDLTAIDDDEGIMMKHFFDCALIAPLIPEQASLADVGSGAGFPGMVLAILRPDIEVSCIEATQKRCRFLEETANLCGLVNLTVINARAEEAVQNYRESFDVVCARAVAALDILSELCLPLVKVGGRFIAMKGQKAAEEVKNAESAIKKLGGKEIIVHAFEHPLLGHRTNIEIMKVRLTPKQYPRTYARIKKTPL